MTSLLPFLLGATLVSGLALSGVRAADFTFQSDVEYLGAERTEKLDVYLPPESFPRPVPAMLLIHGGGWTIGDKADKRERNIGATLAAHGIAVFSINYLLDKVEKDEQGKKKSVTKAWPQNFYDCKSALRFMKKESARFGIDPQRIGVMGGSAGGHLAMLVGVTGQAAAMNQGGLYLDQDNGVRCIIDLYGIHDVRKFQPSHFSGSTPEETERNLDAASPCTYFSSQTPPLLILHGDADKIVNVEMSRDLVRQLQAKGIVHEYVEVPGAPHTFHLEPKEMDLRPVTLKFLDTYLVGAPAKP
ncbi:MAG: lipase [Verrucomicrobia bacterium Tous-C9LFEB]|nr:MAG: lipase [Verrucomicrobia bacterium Tous-C9LFEB]